MASLEAVWFCGAPSFGGAVGFLGEGKLTVVACGVYSVH